MFYSGKGEEEEKGGKIKAFALKIKLSHLFGHYNINNSKALHLENEEKGQEVAAPVGINP